MMWQCCCADFDVIPICSVLHAATHKCLSSWLQPLQHCGVSGIPPLPALKQLEVEDFHVEDGQPPLQQLAQQPCLEALQAARWQI